jgi:hypothetical protein
VPQKKKSEKKEGVQVLSKGELLGEVKLACFLEK